MLISDSKKPEPLKRSLIIGTAAGAIGFIGSSLINKSSRNKEQKPTTWAERLQNEEVNKMDIEKSGKS